ncbi:MAG TPA: hypothetical protein VGV61_08735, partial [Thermoanaerobaculia bacterium]|nr:hypothetical protein [Thermoanaerobaculia bacterium]
LAALLAGAALAAASHPPPAAEGRRCDQVTGNLVGNCDFTTGIEGWNRQAATALAHDHRGHAAPGALRMTNEPASEAGAATCVPVKGGATYEISGWLQRLDGAGECLSFVEEHGTPDCSAGATSFHELVSTPLVSGGFQQVAGVAAVGSRTVAVRAGFACYGEQDDDVSGVLLDDVVLRRVTPAAGGGT